MNSWAGAFREVPSARKVQVQRDWRVQFDCALGERACDIVVKRGVDLQQPSVKEEGQFQR